MKTILLLGLFGLMLGVTDARADRDDHRRGGKHYKHNKHNYGRQYGQQYRGPSYYGYSPGYDHDYGYGYGPARFAPPPMRREFCGRSPSPRHVWVPGYYGWGGNDYDWNDGYWAMPPRPRAVWVPGYWRPQNGLHIWFGGSWR